MHVVVVGATGNVGSSLLGRLVSDDRIRSIVGVARRKPSTQLPKVEWRPADITRDDLDPVLRGADAVVHLAWLIQPSRDPATLERTNVAGSARIFEATARSGARALVYASSVGAYSPGPANGRVREDWPIGGVPSSFYARHKTEVEHELDAFERAHPEIRVVRMRPALSFKRGAASEIQRLFAGPLLPARLLRPGLLPVVPDVDGLSFQVVHTDDVARAYQLALASEVHGAFNLAAEPVLDAHLLARTLGAKVVPVPPMLARAAISSLWRLRLQPTPPGWLDLAQATPLMDTSRARSQLGWSPARSADDTLLELLEGLREGAGEALPPLASARDEPGLAPGPIRGLDGEWNVCRAGGLMPPLPGVTKQIAGTSGWTALGPLRVPFDVTGDRLAYRALVGLTDVVTAGRLLPGRRRDEALRHQGGHVPDDAHELPVRSRLTLDQPSRPRTGRLAAFEAVMRPRALVESPS